MIILKAEEALNMKKAIKIIKKEERANVSATAKSAAPESLSLRQTTREVAGNVASWVKEFQQRRRPDPRQSFTNLFVQPAH
ncbi:MAG: hypothetical protein JO360_08080 [Acidobacteria bacterium]|nr:hypothetical protein [Acidobacteriota bacterium]